MIPPTSIDGTDITGATIDGTDVQEITVDGQTVFSAGLPTAGLKQRYKASDLNLNYGDTVNTWPDSAPDGLDALSDTGTVEYVSTSNGDAVRFDGNSYLRIPNVTTDNELSFFAVIDIDGSGENYIYNAGYNANDSWLALTNSNNKFGFLTADTTVDDFPANSTTFNLELLDVVRQSDGDTDLHQNGTLTNSQNTIDISIDTKEHHIGYAEPRNKAGTELDGDLYEIIIYKSAVSTSKRQKIYDYITDEYGLSLASA